MKKDIQIKHAYDAYIFTIDENDFEMFMYCFNISCYPHHLKSNLKYYNIKYKVKEFLA